MDSKSVIDWLLEGDPSIRWQVHKDLLDSPEKEWSSEQQKVRFEGWGSQLLEKQEPDYSWAKGLYSPKWISTHYTLMLLKSMGLPSDNESAIIACRLLLDKGFYNDGGINFSASMDHSETCVSGMVLSLCSYFMVNDSRINDLALFIINQQMKDGGWNCQSFNGARHSSMHTTIVVLEGLLEYERRQLKHTKKSYLARKKGHEFLLVHSLYKSDKTAKIIKPQFIRLSFPSRWYYDILRALDYFRESGIERDIHMQDAISLLLKKRKIDRWLLQANHPGKVYFDMESVGCPSRWNTLRALRVLKWWDA